MDKLTLQLLLILIIAAALIFKTYAGCKRNKLVKKLTDKKTGIYNDIQHVDTNLSDNIVKTLKDLLRQKELRLSKMMALYMTTGDPNILSKISNCYETIDYLREGLTGRKNRSPIIDENSFSNIVTDSCHDVNAVKQEDIKKTLAELNKQLTHKR